MCLVLRFMMVPKKTIAYTTHTIVMAISIGHSSSAYSLVVVRPKGKVIAAATITAFQPQKVKAAKGPPNKRA